MKFPPSSPFYGCHDYDKSIDRDIDIFNYPSPEPSSSIGDQSSSPTEIAPEKKYPTKSALENSYILSIANNDSRQFTIGRERSICDVTLPKLPHISRQHVFVQYLNHDNRLKITCNGSNTISILLGKKYPLVLFKTTECNEFVLDENVQHCNPGDIHLLDAFTLRKHDVVYMPVLKNIAIMVSGTKTEINIQSPSSKKTRISNVDADISTDTDEDSKLIHLNEESLTISTFETPSKRLIPAAQSPSTGKILEPLLVKSTDGLSVRRQSANATPFIKGFVIPEPSTPIKKSCLIRSKLNNTTPVPVHKKAKLELADYDRIDVRVPNTIVIEKKTGKLKFFDSYTDLEKPNRSFADSK